MNNKVMLCFYKDSVNGINKVLKSFDELGFVIHIFDNIDSESLGKIELDNIIENLFGENYPKNNINIVSNIEILIVDLFKRYSWNYNSFIFDNLNYKNEYKAKLKENYKYNFNLYAINNWNEEIKYITLKKSEVDKFYFEKLENYFVSAEEICKDNNLFYQYYEKLENKAHKINNYITNNINEFEKEKIEEVLLKELNNDNDIYVMYIASFGLYTFKRKIYGDKILELTLNSKVIDKNNKFFIMYQLISKSFTDVNISQSIDGIALDNIYEKSFDQFKDAGGKYEFIPKNKRDKDLVFVFVSQFLTLEHGPTKTALDRCYSLIKYLGKRVILINTKELITLKGVMPINKIVLGNDIQRYEEMDSFEYRGLRIPFYQPSCSMPDENEITNILELVSKYKPYLMLNIGGNSITADLASQIVPMATISTSGNYSIGRSKGQFFILGRKATEIDYKYIIEKGYKKEAIIECVFTFALKVQEHSYFKKDFGIPENKFIVTVIGGRLQNEVDEEFISMLDKIATKECYIISIGGFKISENLAKKYPNFTSNFKDLGFQTDILACIDLVDLCLNPKRQGGGTSAVECMHKGKPAISLKYGDVSMLLNDEGIVNNYDEMIKLVEKCKSDKLFYVEMSNKAKLKAVDLMDTKKYLKKMYYDIVKNPLFK